MGMDGMQKHLFAVAVLNVRKETCSIKVARDLDDSTFIEQFFEQFIPYTSFPEGSWKFYLIYGANQITCMLPPEY